MKVLIVVLISSSVFVQCQPNRQTDKTILPEEVHRIIYDSTQGREYVLFDIRDRMDYIRGHVASAVWLSRDSIKLKLPALVKEKRIIIIYDSDDRHLPEVANVFLQNGVTHFYVMKGGFSKWAERGYPAAIQLVRNTDEQINARWKDISITGAQTLLGNLISNVVLVDIRPYPAFVQGHIEGARSIPYVPLNEFVIGVEQQQFARNMPIILYCDAFSDFGEKAADVMLRNDFTEIYLLKCSMGEWYSSVSARNP